MAEQSREALLEERQYQALAEAVGPPSSDEDLDTLRIRARLAVHGYATLIDALRAARRAIEEGAADAPALAASAARLLAKAGAAGTAAGLLREARDRVADPGAVELAERQLAAGRLDGDDERAWALHGLLADGELERARATARELAAELAPGERVWVLRIVADLARGARDFAEAARAFEQAHDDTPHAYDAPSLACAAAICRWASGDVGAALESLRALAETHRGARGAAAWAHVWATDVLDRLDAHPERRDGGPQWRFVSETASLAHRAGDLGTAALGLACDLLGLAAPPSAPRPTMAHLLRALRARDIRSVRAAATPESLTAALAHGLVPILEEEQPTETGFLVVLGFDPIADLLLVHDPRRAGAQLRTYEDHRHRARIAGCGALFLAGLGDAGEARLSASGLAHDARFDLVDRCDLDEHGEPPPRARVDVLAREGIERAPDLPSLHLRHGESLLAQLRAGQLEGGRMERWYAVTRERFRHAEWALQLYAQALEVWGRPYEAHVAWADARAIDPQDERSSFGMARTAIRTGDRPLGERLLERTLAQRHGYTAALAELARLRLEQGDLDTARLASALAEELAPTDRAALSVRASVMEAEDRFDDARDRLEQILRRHEGDSDTRARYMRRLCYDGRFDDAHAEAEALVRLDPADAHNWADLGWIATVRGDGAAAMDALRSGLERCGPAGALVEQVARTLGSLLGAEARDAAIASVEPLLASDPLTLLDVSVELARRGLDGEAAQLALAGEALLSHDANGPWRAAQTLLVLPGQRERVVPLLEETIARAPRYPHPRVVLGLLGLAEDPARAVELAAGADPSVAPALVFWILARANEAAGRPDDAQSAAGRVRELDALALADGARFLRNVHLFEAAHSLFEEALSRAPDDLRIRHDYARSLARAGDWEGASAQLATVSAGASAVDPFFGSLVAAACGDFARAADLAEPEVVRARRASAGGYDLWPLRGRLAGARLALGDRDEAAAFRQVGASHPDALLAFVTIERAIGDPNAAADAARLAERAPGAALTLKRGGLRW